jgi:hypothetical protein
MYLLFLIARLRARGGRRGRGRTLIVEEGGGGGVGQVGLAQSRISAQTSDLESGEEDEGVAVGGGGGEEGRAVGEKRSKICVWCEVKRDRFDHHCIFIDACVYAGIPKTINACVYAFYRCLCLCWYSNNSKCLCLCFL